RQRLELAVRKHSHTALRICYAGNCDCARVQRRWRYACGRAARRSPSAAPSAILAVAFDHNVDSRHAMTDPARDEPGGERPGTYHSKKDRIFVRAIQGAYNLGEELQRLR